MKLLLFLLFTATCFAQISITKEVEPEKKIIEYDSSYNFPGENIEALIGQTLYLPPKGESLREYGWDEFLIAPEYSANNYQTGSRYKNTVHDSLANQNFKLLEVIENTGYSISYDYFLKVLREKTGDTLYYKYDSEHYYDFDFIVMGYFDKLQERIGSSIVIVPFYKPEKNIDTGEEFTIENIENNVWEIQEITIYGKYASLSFIVKNSDGIRLAKNVLDEDKWFYSEKKVEDFKRRFPNYYKNIIKRTIRVGMPEEAVLLSWGKPEKINRSSYGSDQWVYDGDYVYMENGKVKSWN